MPFDAEVPAHVTQRDNLLRLRDLLESLAPERFNMRFFAAEHNCGTVGCIAGWTLRMAKLPREGDESEQAGKILGLNLDQRMALFFPTGYDEEGRYSLPHAVAVLDHLIATGEVDWSVTFKGDDQ